MAAGLPGTGIGGLFFILSAFFMIPLELVQTIRGRSSLARWRIVGRNAAVAAMMVATVTVVIWLLHGLLFGTATKAGGARGKTSGVADQLVPFAPVLITLAVLAAVLVGAYLAKFLFRTRSTFIVEQASDRRRLARSRRPAVRARAEPLLADGPRRSKP